ncbi:hypothetical protein [Acidovorax kalamii]|nr:hypothetical protein [Acidovorax kalamii]
MRIEILNEQGDVINTILADKDFAEANYPGAWQVAADQGMPPGPTVPDRVTRRQALQALLLAGVLDNVQPAIDAIPDPIQRRMAQIEWDESQVFERRRPLLVTLGAALGLDSAGLDQLFIQAGALP